MKSDLAIIPKTSDKGLHLPRNSR